MPGTGLAETSGRTAQELLAEFEQTGNQAPFEEIVRRYSGMVYSVCYQVTRNAHDAEDAAQATFLTLSIQHKSSRNVKYVGPWLQHVAHRTSLDLRRSRKRRAAREERHGEMELQSGRLDPVSPPIDRDEVRTILRDELNKLPAKYRLPLILHYFGGLTPGEISKELGCRPKTLGVRLFRGRKMLAQNLADRGVTVSAGFLAFALIDAIQHTVAEGFIQHTSHAAAHFALAPHCAAGGLISDNVLGLTYIAGRAITLSKLKITFALVMVCASAMSGAAEMVRRYAPSNWQLHFDMPQLLDQGIRAIFDGFRKPIQGFADATPTEPMTVAPGQSTHDGTARFAYASGYTTPVDLGGTGSWSPVSPISGSNQSRSAAASLTPLLVSQMQPNAAGSGISTMARAELDREFTGAGSAPTRLSSAPSSRGPQSDRALRIGSNGSSPESASLSIGGISEAAYSSSNPSVASGYGPEPFTGSAASQQVSQPSRPAVGPMPIYGQDFGYAMGPTPLSDQPGGVVPVVLSPTPPTQVPDRSSVEPPAPQVLASASVAVTTGTNTYAFSSMGPTEPMADSSSPDLPGGIASTFDSLIQVDDVQLTMRSVVDPGNAQIEQLALTNSTVPALPDASGQDFVSIWSFDTTAFASGGLDVVVRYDDLVSKFEGSGATTLRLWGYDDGEWMALADSTLMTDMGTNLLWGHAPDLEYFALSADAIPEPTGAVVLFLGTAIAGLSRRRLRA